MAPFVKFESFAVHLCDIRITRDFPAHHPDGLIVADNRLPLRIPRDLTAGFDCDQREVRNVVRVIGRVDRAAGLFACLDALREVGGMVKPCGVGAQRLAARRQEVARLEQGEKVRS
jgi:hypothetical protein